MRCFPLLWDEGFSGDLKISPKIVEKLIIMDEDPIQEFEDPHPLFAKHKHKWWDTLISMKKYKVESSDRKAHWPEITSLTVLTVDVSPHICSYIKALGAWKTDRKVFQKAMGILSRFHKYSALKMYCDRHTDSRESVLAIVLALLEDGLVSPRSAAWAAKHLSRDPRTYSLSRFHFAAYSTHCITIWNHRNHALQAYKTTLTVVEPSVADAQGADTAVKSSAGASVAEAIVINNNDDDADMGALTQLVSILSSDLHRGADKSAISSPCSAHPCSLSGAPGWHLPVSETTTKYSGVIPSGSTKKKKAKSAAASMAGDVIKFDDSETSQPKAKLVIRKAPVRKVNKKGVSNK